MLLQARDGSDCVVALVGRRLRPKEPHPEPVVAKLLITQWAVRALARYTQYASPIRVPVEDPECLLVLRECEMA